MPHKHRASQSRVCDFLSETSNFYRKHWFSIGQLIFYRTIPIKRWACIHPITGCVRHKHRASKVVFMIFYRKHRISIGLTKSWFDEKFYFFPFLSVTASHNDTFLSFGTGLEQISNFRILSLMCRRWSTPLSELWLYAHMGFQTQREVVKIRSYVFCPTHKPRILLGNTVWTSNVNQCYFVWVSKIHYVW